MSHPRVAIASRIFAPEPSAAAFRLSALAEEFSRDGWDVEVLTVRPPKRLAKETADETTAYRVRRAPVLRDKSGYVRGYLQYMSFDIPLFFRVLLGRKRDLIVAEPPPTTGAFVRLATSLRRTPYVYYAADIWADASAQTGAPNWVVRILRTLERFAWRGATVVLSVSSGVTDRLAELGVTEGVRTIGNGVDTDSFRNALQLPTQSSEHDSAEFVYAGTASEWHGAQVFLEAMPYVLERYPGTKLRYIGGGSERDALESRAEALGISAWVTVEDPVSPAILAPILGGSAAALASVRPGGGYDFAFPTKLYSAAACGAPLIFAGAVGPAPKFVSTLVDGYPLGVSVDVAPKQVAEAMIEALTHPADAERRRVVAAWASHSVSLRSVASLAIAHINAALGKPSAD